MILEMENVMDTVPNINKYLLCITLLLLVLMFAFAPQTQTQEITPYNSNPSCPMNAPGGTSIPGSCTTFVAQTNDKVLFGNNEDFNNPDTYLWVVPSSDDGYGGVYLGYQFGKPQGGINEKGLAFDALALPKTALNPHPELPSRGNSDSLFIGKIMSQNATVDEAIAFAQGFNWGSSVSFQVLFADASGDAVIISGGADGELAFTRKPKGNGYLLGTNFNRANPENGSYPCSRYDTAEAMLTKIEAGASLNVEAFKAILDATHAEGVDQNTLYSNIIDLPNGMIYVYYWHQFDEVLTLNVVEQINSGMSPTRLTDLFSSKTVNQAEEEYQQHVDRVARDEWLNKYFKIIVVGGGLVILGAGGSAIYFYRRKKLLGSPPAN
jgi:hypothetical protein